MSTTAVNNIVRGGAQAKSRFPSALNLISSAISYNQGDLMYLDQTNHLIKALDSDAHGATFIGVAIQTVINGKLTSAYQGTSVDAAQAIEDVSGPVFDVVVNLKLKSGDAFTAGCAVYGTAVDAQTVSSTGTNLIGYFQDAAITAGSSSKGNVMLKAAI